MTDTTTPTYDTRAALLAAIAAHPDEDVPRLMYADELEETDPARAAFIRVQCELAKWKGKDSEHCPTCGLHWRFGNGGPQKYWCENDHEWFPHERRELQAREQELLRENETRWRAGVPCGACGGKGRQCRSIVRDIPGKGRCAVGQENVACEACWHTGDAGGLLRRFRYWQNPDSEADVRKTEPVRVSWVRGFADRVTVPMLEDVVVQMPPELRESVHGPQPRRRAPSPWLRSVLDDEAVPDRSLITQVVPLDREPNRWDDRVWHWQHSPTGTEHDGTIPRVIYDQLTKHTFFTADEAKSELGRAIVAFGRH